jgi:hypothetical protein
MVLLLRLGTEPVVSNVETIIFIACAIALSQSPRAGLLFSLHQLNKIMSLFVEIGRRKKRIEKTKN